MCPWDSLQAGRWNFHAATSAPSVLAVLQEAQRQFNLGKCPDIILHANACKRLVGDARLVIPFPVGDHLRPVGTEAFDQFQALDYECFPAFIENRTFGACPPSH
jgi:hypothetical protein